MKITGSIPPYSDRQLTVGVLLPGVLTYRNWGLTGSAMARAKALGRKGVHSLLLTHIWQPYLADEVALLEESGRIDPDVTSVANLYDDLARSSESGKLAGPVPSRLSDFFDEGILESTSRRGDIAEVQVRRGIGADSALVRFRPESNVVFSFSVKTALGDDVFFPDQEGNIGRRQIRDLEQNILLDEYFNREGLTYLEYRSSGHPGYFWIHGGRTRIGSKEDLIAFWIERCYPDTLTDVLISEFAPHSRHLDALLKVREKLGTKVFLALHSNHYLPPFRRGAEVLPTLAPTLSRASEADGLVVLTPEQIEDLTADFPALTNAVHIPHAIEKERGETQVERDPDLMVIVSRLEDGKGFLEAVRAIAARPGHLDGRRLEIFGSGPGASQLEALLSEVDLGDTVTYRGFTDSPADEYGRAAVALFPNSREAQPLSLMEAMLCGAVPVSLDYSYGPRMLIEDGETGRVIEGRNFSELIDTALEVMTDTDERERLSRNAREYVTETYTTERLADDWLDLFEQKLGERRAAVTD